MWPGVSRLAMAALVFMMSACGGSDPNAGSTLPESEGADTPETAVTELVKAMNAAEFTAASRFAVPGQAALASLAEGATFSAVADALRNGDHEIAANFWSGFAQGAGSFLAGDVTVAGAGTVEEGGLQFHTVSVTPAGGEVRTVLVREVDGFRVDLFASFGQGLADKMIDPVERLLGTQTEDARRILAGLQDIVPSLLAAARLPDTPSAVSQQLLALVEVITRVG